MKTIRGFQIKKRVTRFVNRIHQRRRTTTTIATGPGPGSGLLGWVKRKAKGLLNRSSYVRLGRAEKVERAGGGPVPKGHLAVYVGQKEDDCCRVLVPVFYFNHPLFGRLLSEAEEKFGFEYPGRITIPCPVSEFESVTTKIQAMAKSQF